MATVKSSRWFFKASFLIPLVSILGGGLAGWSAAELVVNPRFDRLERLWRERPTTVATSTSRAIEVVQLARQPLAPLYPEGLVAQRLSPTVVLVKRTLGNKTGEEHILGDERIVGNAVALTSDGWIACTNSALANMRLADLAVAVNGRTYPAVKIVRDSFTDLVFIKTDARDTGIAAFERPQDVVAGMGAWLEASPKRYSPQSIVDTRLDNAGSLSSERATRRFLVSGAGESIRLGTAVWSSAGRLIGFVEAKVPAGWRVIPAGDLAAAFSSLLDKGIIEHASLGLRAIDLSSVTFEGTREPLPLRGAWIRSDRKNNASAVLSSGPSARLIKDGDVIDRVERDILDGTVDVGELLLDYRPSSTVTLYGTRNNEAFQTSVTLGRVIASETLK